MSWPVWAGKLNQRWLHEPVATRGPTQPQLGSDLAGSWLQHIVRSPNQYVDWHMPTRSKGYAAEITEHLWAKISFTVFCMKSFNPHRTLCQVKQQIRLDEKWVLSCTGSWYNAIGLLPDVCYTTYKHHIQHIALIDAIFVPPQKFPPKIYAPYLTSTSICPHGYDPRTKFSLVWADAFRFSFPNVTHTRSLC